MTTTDLKFYGEILEQSGCVESAGIVLRAAVAMNQMARALDAAEEILRYCPDISTNVNGTRRSMTTRAALAEVRAALNAAGYEVTK